MKYFVDEYSLHMGIDNVIGARIVVSFSMTSFTHTFHIKSIQALHIVIAVPANINAWPLQLFVSLIRVAATQNSVKLPQATPREGDTEDATQRLHIYGFGSLVITNRLS